MLKHRKKMKNKKSITWIWGIIKMNASEHMANLKWRYAGHVARRKDGNIESKVTGVETLDGKARL